MATVHALAERDGSWCHYCFQPLHVGDRPETVRSCWPDATIDHIRARRCGGGDDLANLVLACRWCNAAKQARPYEIFIRETRDIPRPLRRWDGLPYPDGIAA